MSDLLILGSSGGDVAILHQRLLGLGLAVPAEEARTDHYGPGTEEMVRRLQAERALPVTGAVDEATARSLGLAGAQPTMIHGVASSPDGVPLPSFAVRLCQVTVRGDKLLAESRTGPDGTFMFPWPKGITTGLVVRADRGSGGEVPLASPAAGAWVRVSVGGPYLGVTRLASVTATISPSLQGSALHELGDSGRDHELALVSTAAGIAVPELRRLVLAHKLAAKTKVPIAAFFALLDQRVPATVTTAIEATEAAAPFDDAQVDHVLHQMLQLRGDSVRAALEAAAQARAVAPTELAGAAEAFHALRVEHLGRRPFRLGKTPFRDVLATILPAAAQTRVLEAYANHGTTSSFWEALEKPGELSATQLEHLRFTLKATVLLRNHLPLLVHVQQQRAAGKLTNVADLARLDEADWLALLRQTDPKAEHIGFTANLKFATLEERLAHFAELLSRQCERRYPTAAFAGRLAKDRDDLGLAARKGVQHILDTQRSFSLRRTHIDRFVKDHGAAAFAGLSAGPEPLGTPTDVIADLKKLQRVVKLAPRFAHAKAMLVGGYGSAHSIYAAGRSRFIETMVAAGATPSDGRAIYARAAHAHATTLALLGTFNSAFNSLSPSAVAQPLSTTALQPLLAGFPNLQSLFGANDYCACQHCRAIHGPAAYLVDLLQFLRYRVATSGSARDVLLARRPDLGALELSCANSNGVLPYIDLACEILEDAVVAPSAATLRARQTSGSAQELRANPRFVNEPAYAALRSAVFPLSAPFDLWTAEVRAFLGQLGVPWHDLLAALQVPAAGATPASPPDVQLAGERLGLHSAALALVTTAAPAQPWTHWGLQETANSVPDPRKPNDTTAVITGTWLQILAFVPIFLHRAAVSHRELVQLLATRFINPGGAIKIIETSSDGFASCDTGKQAIATWTPEALSRCNRFVRLWRQLGCTIWDLDKVLSTAAVGGAAIDVASVLALDRITLLSKRLNLPWDELLGLWADLDRVPYVNVIDDDEPTVPSVYARRFCNASVSSTTSVFVEDPTLLAGLLGSADATAGIVAALNLSSAELQLLRGATGLAAAAAPLNLGNLSVLFRHAVLASALRLSIADLLVAIAVTGVTPFASPAATLAFVTALDQSRASGFSLAELHYLLRHGSALDSGIAIADATLTGWLDDVRKALARGAGSDGVERRLSDLLPLPPEVAHRAFAATLPGASAPMSELFADPRLVERGPDGAFVHRSDRTAFASLFEALVVLDKLRLVLTRWRVSNQDAQWLLDHAAQLGWLALTALPATTAHPAIELAKLTALHANLVMQQTLVAPDHTRLFDIALQRSNPRDTVAASLAALGGWTTADVLALANRFGWTTGPSLLAGATAPRLNELMSWPRKLGTDIAEALTFVTGNLTATEARKARQLTKARYDLEKWHAVSGAIHDGLREAKRSALVAWLLANPSPTRGQRWTNLEELYGFCLIDPQMSACAETTRIKQAAASVQLFVQRCLLQREPAVSVNVDTDTSWYQWEWMKRFRLWEANRKIFLYPENWIDPSQRRFKSDFFAELEAELQQGDLTKDTTEDALLNYLHKLDEVSHLEICGVGQQVDYGQRLLHVVARTRKAPHVYYYRRRGGTGVWAPWEKLDAEIDSDNVMPVYWNRRLHVFWTEAAEKSLPTSSSSRVVPTAGGGIAAEPTRYWELNLAWTEKRRERWMPKRLSKHKQLMHRYRKNQFVLKAPTNGRTLEVDLYLNLYPGTVFHQARWQLTSNGDEPVLFHAALGGLAGVEEAAVIRPLLPVQTRPSLMVSSTLDWSGNLQLSRGATTLSLLEGSPQQDLAVLGRISGARVTPLHQDLQFTSQAPFFVSDPQRTFFVTPSFISTSVYSRWVPSGTVTYTTQYSLAPFYHPFVDTFLQELSWGGLGALYSRRLQLTPEVVRGGTPFNFVTEYQPTTAVPPRAAPEPPYPVETIDYSHDGAYSLYNWELFFHAPFLIAKRLADNQRFDEALRWFHTIFNPTATTGGAAPQRYWIPKMFHELTAADYARSQLEKILQLVSQGDPELVRKIGEWRNDPFDPHLIAASRPVAYQKAVVMQYIATLIAWGDQLFRADTIESINEATQLYLMASELLGPRPQNLRTMQPRQAKTYGELAPQLDAFSNALVDIENVISIPPPLTAPSSAPLPQLHTFYFCVPHNEKLLAFWDTVADRLFKVRNCLNLDGVARKLAMYEPPIEPELLTRAAAAGVELSAVLADEAVELPCYRFPSVWQRAYDLCQDVRSLGSSVLSALERRDAEELARVRSAQEVTLLHSLHAAKRAQLTEAQTQRSVLEAARDAAVGRRDYYASREFVNDAELLGLALSGTAMTVELAATISGALASVAHALPSITAGAAGFGGSPLVTATTGGGAVGSSATAAANVLRTVASHLQQGASLATTVGSYQRRRDDWDLQRRTADKEITQLDRQLIAADIRIAIARRELEVHEQQQEDARTTAELLTSKFTNRELYDWILSQLSTTYFQAYQLAYNLAKRASRAYAFELGTDDPGYIQFGTWDSLHKGMNAGDKLLLDLRRLQAEHLRRNQRELELTKHVSLAQLDPMALVKLRQTGECFLNLPESLFDLDQPGHYLRRLKTVSVTLPCVTGPYTGVNATLTLLTHATRRSEVPGTQYLPVVDSDGVPLPSDPRFTRGTGTASVALSTGNQDAGMFEVNFHDERYLPFEGLGAISHWHLELPKDTNRFEVSTLSDVVLHLRYTARDGGPALRTAARQAVTAALPRTGARLLSARTEFPDAWARLWAPLGAGQRLELALGEQHLPWLPDGQRLKLTGVSALLLFTEDQTYAAYQAAPVSARLRTHLGFSTADGTPPAAAATFSPEPTLAQLPIATLPLAGDAAPLTLAFLEADLAAAPLLGQIHPAPDGAHHRLRRDRIEDILFLVSYRLEARS